MVAAGVKPSRKTSKDYYWPPPQGKWTYDDYTRLPNNGMRYEVIEGELYMSPAPNPQHQRVIVALLRHLLEYLQQQPIGEVLISPIDVILSNNLAAPVQPDLLFIAKDRLDIVKEKSIEGVPDLIVEVLSPGNPAHDRQIDPIDRFGIAHAPPENARRDREVLLEALDLDQRVIIFGHWPTILPCVPVPSRQRRAARPLG